jgi:hypothetical protein
MAVLAQGATHDLLLRRGRQELAHSGADLMRRHVRSWRKQTLGISAIRW